MVAVVAGSGLGLFNASQSVLGAAGMLGQGLQGQGGGRAYVNAATGNLVLQGRDQDLSGRGADLDLLRTYNSQGVFVNAQVIWSWDSDRTVKLTAGTVNASGSQVTRTTGDGHATVYTFDGTAYVSSDGDGANDRLTYSATAHQWTWVDGSTQRTDVYGDSQNSTTVGRLQSQSDVSGNKITFGYSGGNGPLTTVTDFASGQQVRLIYSTSSPVRLLEMDTFELQVDSNGKVSDPPVVGTTPTRRVLYEYVSATDSRLAKVKTDLTPSNTTDSSFFVTAYTYDGASGRIATLTQNDGSSSGGTPFTVSFTYEQIAGSNAGNPLSWRVKTVTDANGKQTFNYGTGTTDIVISDALGGNAQTWTYTYDSKKQLTNIQSPAPVAGGSRLSTQFFYDANGNVKKIIDANGKSVIYQYDANNNWIVQRDQLGNTIFREYDAKNQLTSETHYTTPDTSGLDEATIGVGNAGGALTTHFVYDSSSRLRFTISADGRVVQNSYNTATGADGLLASTRHYTADLYTGTSYSESDLSTWAAGLADKTKQQLTEYFYDFRGNLSTTKDYASVDANGTGVLGTTGTLTQYIYDGHGQLVHSIVLHGSDRTQGTQTSHAYDALGRETSRIDASGTQTTSYNDQTGAVTVVTQAGQQIVSTFNGVGQLTSITRSDSTNARATQYFYDPQGRLQLTLDAQGGRHFSFYDQAGRLSAQVDSTGHVTSYTYDAAGHVLTSTSFANTVGSTDAWVSKDAGGNITGVTKHLFTVAAAAGAGVDLVTSPATAPVPDRTTTFHYDDAERLDKAFDAAGTETDTSYDGLSRVTSTSTGGRVTRMYYNGDGLLVGTLDPLGFLTENKYDAAGQLTQTLHYAARSPLANDVAAPVWIGVADQTVPALKPFSVHLPAFDADGDPLKGGFSVVGTLPSWLTMTPDDGGVTLSGTPPAQFSSFPVTLRANDGRGGQADVSLNIVVTDTPPVWSGAPRDAAVAVNTAGYSLNLPGAVDSEGGAVTYSIISALPAGLTFDAGAMKISGTPTAVGMYTITVRATDAQGRSSDTSFVLQVGGLAPAFASAVQPQTAFRNQAYSLLVPGATSPGETPTYSIVSGPSWLHIDAVTHMLTGTPPAYADAQTVVVRARGAAGDAFLSFTIAVPNRPVTWAAFTPPTTTAPNSINFQPPAAVDPDNGALTYFVSKGALPSGWTIDSATGRIQGSTNTQKIGSYTVTLSVRDDGDVALDHASSVTQVDHEVTFVVANATPVFTGTAYTNVDVFANASGSFSFSKSLTGFSDPDGGSLTFSFAKPSFVTSAIVNGTTVSFGGVLTGGIKTGTMTITATDAFGAAVSRSFTVTVEPHSTLAPTFGGGATAAPTDPLAVVRPLDTTALSSYVYYDSEGRVVGTVDEQGFLTETVYDESANTQQAIRYFKPLTVSATDTLATLRTQALIPDTNFPVLSETSSSRFDDFGRLTSTTDASGTVTNFEYDSAGRLVRQVSAAGTSDQRAVRTRYDTFDEVTGVVSGRGEAEVSDLDTAIATRGTHYVYDSLGRRTQAIDANGNATLFYYDSEGRLTHAVNAQGEVSETQYNAFGQVKKTIRYGTRLDGAHTDGTQPTAGSLLAGLIAGTKSRADLVTALAAMPTASNEATSFDYDQRGLTTTVTDALGLTTVNAYDAFGELHTTQRMIKPAQGGAAAVTTTTQFDYDADGRLESTTGDVGALNFNTQVHYDAYGRVVQSVDGAGKTTVTRYDDNGRTVVVTDPLGRATTTAYDALGRTLTVTDALGHATSFVYDDSARTTTLTTPEGIQVVTGTNRFGQTISVRDGRGNTTSYDYNKDGQLTTSRDALGNVVTNHYDSSGRLDKVTDARGIDTTYRYDAVNRVLLRVVDPTVAGHTGLDLACAYAFDAFGRQTTVTCGKGDLTVAANVASVDSYQYDLDNRQTKVVVDPNGLALATTFSYDGLNNVTQVSQGTVSNPNQQVTQFVFDKLGRRTASIKAPSSIFGAGSASTRDLTTTYRYDPAGRVSRTIDANGQSTWFVYDDAGELRQTINALGEVSENTYDDGGRVVQTRQYLNRLSPSTVVGFGDAIGLQAPTIDPNDRRSYLVYDDDNRLVYTLQSVAKVFDPSAGVPRDWSITQNIYDANGNVVEARQYDRFIDESRLEAIDSSSSPGVTESEVKTELNTLGYTSADSTLTTTRRTHMAYDADNRLRFTVDAEGGIGENVYDAAGNVTSQQRFANPPVLSVFDEGTISNAVDRTNPANQLTRMAYDDAGRLSFTLRQLLPPAGGAAAQYVVTGQVYDSLNRVVQSTAYANLLDTQVNELDPDAIAKALRPSSDDRISAMAYDAAGHVKYTAQAITSNGATKYFVAQQGFDAMGHVTSSTSYATLMSLSDFSLATLDGAVAANTDAQHDRRTDMVYDPAGRLRFMVAADGSLAETVYDAVDRVTEQRAFDVKLDRSFTAMTEVALAVRRAARQVGEGTTRGQSFTYDDAGRLKSTTDAAGYTETTTYDGLGNKQTFQDRNGAIWSYEYYRDGRVRQAIAPAALMQLSGETAPASHALSTYFAYDGLGNLKVREEAHGTADARQTRYDYDLAGRLTLTETPAYDPSLGQVVAGTPDASHGAFFGQQVKQYDKLGNLVRTAVRTGPNSFLSEYRTYDNMGRLKHNVNALGYVTGYDYNTFDGQTAVTRYNKQLATTPPGSDALWSEDEVIAALGSDPNARTITMQYNQRGQVTSVIQPQVASYFDGAASAFDAVAHDVTPAVGAGAKSLEYNAFGELSHETTRLDSTRNQETWHYYDNKGHETRTISKIADFDGEGHAIPSGFHTERSYDTFGNLKQVIEYAGDAPADTSGSLTPPPAPAPSATDRITVYQYDCRNERTDTLRGNLTYTALDGNGNYVQVSTGRDGTVSVDHTTYDGSGHIKTSTDALANVTTYHYNDSGQLDQVTEPARMVAKKGALDPFAAGNQVLASPVTTYVYNAYGQVKQTTRSPGNSQAAGDTLVTSTDYDYGGNAKITKDANGNVTVQKFDFAGRVIKETKTISSVIGVRKVVNTDTSWRTVNHTTERRYAYDALGQRTDVLDVFSDPSGATQSGQHIAYNGFGEVTDTQIEWGSADLAPDRLTNKATITHNVYDNDGHLQTQQAGDGVTQFFYNLAGQVTRTEKRGNDSSADGTDRRISETGYDLMGRVVTQIAPRFSAESNDNNQFFTLPSQSSTSLSLDRWGNALRVTTAAPGQGGFFEYNADNQVISRDMGSQQVLNLDGSSYTAELVHHTSYDVAGRQVQDSDSAENTQTHAVRTDLRTRSKFYDSVGQLTREVDGEGGTTRYAYDTNGRKVATEDQVGTVFVDTFDANGNQLTHGVLRGTDGFSQYTSGSSTTPMLVRLAEYRYDQANRRVESYQWLDPNNNGNDIDNSSNRIAATFQRFDERGLVRETFQVQETRDANGVAFQFDNFAGRATSSTYDIQGDETGSVDAYGNTQTWVYDTAADAGSSATFTFGRLQSLTNTQAGGAAVHTTAYSYNDFGQVNTEQYTGSDITDSDPSHNQRTYSYWENGLVHSVTSHLTTGTIGTVGLNDYLSTSSTSTFYYNEGGQVTRDDEQSSGSFEDFAPFSNTALVTSALPTTNRTTYTSYDGLGRATAVTIFNTGRSDANMAYSYDELGNRRRITFSSTAKTSIPGSTVIGGEVINGRSLWFDYDHEGRMTLANKTVDSNGSVRDQGVALTYDAMGRRATATTFEGRHSQVFVVQTTNGTTEQLGSWDQTRLETYSYSDLGYLARIDQAVQRTNKSLGGVPLTPVNDAGFSVSQLEEMRGYDLQGALLTNDQYSRLLTWRSMQDAQPTVPNKIKTITNAYNSSGALRHQDNVDLTNSKLSSALDYTYDSTTGLLQKYTFTQGDGTGTITNGVTNGFVNTYTYKYEFAGGTPHESRIDLSSNLSGSGTSQTRDYYDSRGNLVHQYQLSPAGTEHTFYSYDASGKAVAKDDLKLDGSRQFYTYQLGQDFFYVNGQSVGDMSASVMTLPGMVSAHFDIVYTPISQINPGAAPGSYTVTGGDTLASIAQNALGDSQLWYVIAEANALSAGPSDSLAADVGRVLRIPTVAGVHNNSGTAAPYNPNTIFNSTPALGFLPPPPDACAETAQVLGMEASIAITVIVGYYLGPLGMGLASLAGDTASQLINIGLRKDRSLSDFSYDEASDAYFKGQVMGYFGAGAGVAVSAAADVGAGAAALAAAGSAAAGYALNYGLSQEFNPAGVYNPQGTAFSVGDLATHTAFGLLAPFIGGAADKFANAFSPSSGWWWKQGTEQWNAILYEATSAGVGLAAQAVADSLASSPRRPADPAVAFVPGTAPIADQSPYSSGDGSSASGADPFLAELQRLEPSAQYAGLETQDFMSESIDGSSGGGGFTLRNLLSSLHGRNANANTSDGSYTSQGDADEIALFQAENEAAVARNRAAAAQQGPVLGPERPPVLGPEKPPAPLSGGLRNTADQRGPLTEAEVRTMADRAQQLRAASNDYFADPANLQYTSEGVPTLSSDPVAGSSRTVVVDRQAAATDEFAELDRAGFDEQTQTSSASDSYLTDAEYRNAVNQELATHQSQLSTKSLARDATGARVELQYSGVNNAFQVDTTYQTGEGGAQEVQLRRLAETGFKEIHVSIGAHGSPDGTVTPDSKLLDLDIQVVNRVRDAYPQTTIKTYDLGDPYQAEAFWKIQAQTASAPSADVASLNTTCFSSSTTPSSSPAYYSTDTSTTWREADDFSSEAPTVDLGPPKPGITKGLVASEVPPLSPDGLTFRSFAGTGLKWGGRAALAYGLGKDAYSFGETLGTAQDTGNYQPVYKEAVRIGGAWAGLSAGAQAGAELGSVFGPFGTFFGGLGGGAAGYVVGGNVVNVSLDDPANGFVIGRPRPMSMAELGIATDPNFVSGGYAGPIY